jgi:hypothetical protein
MDKKTTQQIQEGNKLIADFDGKKWTDDKSEFMRSDEDLLFPESLYYHVSWDWLMPVCYKWDNLNELLGNPEYEQRCDELDRVASLYEIEPLWTVLVENIKWFNQQTQNNNNEKNVR